VFRDGVSSDDDRRDCKIIINSWLASKFQGRLGLREQWFIFLCRKTHEGFIPPSKSRNTTFNERQKLVHRVRKIPWASMRTSVIVLCSISTRSNIKQYILMFSSVSLQLVSRVLSGLSHFNGVSVASPAGDPARCISVCGAHCYRCCIIVRLLLHSQHSWERVHFFMSDSFDIIVLNLIQGRTRVACPALRLFHLALFNSSLGFVLNHWPLLRDPHR
jgi:hypothetical protein